MTDLRQPNRPRRRTRRAGVLPAPRRPPAWLHVPIASTANTRVTSVDVARRAGVSQSTVSLVFSGKGRGRVSAATQETVRRCARELGYRPNVAAQALRLGSSRAVALLVPDVTNPFFARVLRGAQRAAQEAGYTVALVDTGNDRRWEEQSFEALRAGPVDGYLLFEVMPPEGIGPRRARRAHRVQGAAALVGALRLRGRRRGRLRAPARARPSPHRPPRRRLRRAHLPPARGRPAARARPRPGSTPTRCRAR